MIRVTEAAALASARFMGRGDRVGADRAATEAMRRAMEEVDISGTVVIGEGERDEAPMLYIGEKVGTHGESAVEVDIAVDPLEGTNLVASGQANAITVLAVSERGGLLHAPDTYMEKLCVGPPPPRRADRRGARDRGAHQAHQRRGPLGRDQLRRSGHRHPRGHGYRRGPGRCPFGGRPPPPRRR